MNEVIKKILKASLIIVFVSVLFALIADVYVAISGKQARIYERVDDLPSAQAVLVLGAAVYRDGRLSAIFQDRASTALEIYRSGKAQKILVSGDHSVGNYDEVNAAKKFFLKNGVAGGDLFVDYAGFDTYSSVYRAKDIFQVSSLIIVTQDFHLPRALFIARSLGVDAVGASADLRTYNLGFYNVLRENGARAKAFWDVAVSARPHFLGVPIPITGDGRSSWDSK